MKNQRKTAKKQDIRFAKRHSAKSSGEGNGLSRRDFIGAAAVAAAFTIVPGHVLGLSGEVSPSNRITMGCIGLNRMGWHVLISMAAAEAGKDIYCEKPLSKTVAEGRTLCETIKRYKRVYQTGTQLGTNR